MGESIIRWISPVPAAPAAARGDEGLPAAATPAPGADRVDRLGRPLRDLRISVTDRCNFRCRYCMPKEVFDHKHDYLPHAALLSFEEIARVAGAFTVAGVRKLRLTGGEPLLRKGIETLVAQLAALRTPDGAPLDIAMTTNGSLLAGKAAALKAAGLTRVTVSLDAIDDRVFRAMNDVDFPVAEVLAGIDAAIAAGLGPVKVNMVVKKGTNDDQIVPLARALRERHGRQVVLRFIEYMDVGTTNGWQLDEVLPAADVLARLAELGPLTALSAGAPGETAQRFAWSDGVEVGLISSVTRAFCGDCNRARLSTEGQVYLCLFASQGHDLRGLLRGGADDAALVQAVDTLWGRRTDQYSALRAKRAEGGVDAATGAAAGHAPRKVEMHYIGG
jgi:cyclic pyranopterin phosphate synthase